MKSSLNLILVFCSSLLTSSVLAQDLLVSIEVFPSSTYQKVTLTNISLNSVLLDSITISRDPFIDCQYSHFKNSIWISGDPEQHYVDGFKFFSQKSDCPNLAWEVYDRLVVNKEISTQQPAIFYFTSVRSRCRYPVCYPDETYADTLFFHTKSGTTTSPLSCKAFVNNDYCTSSENEIHPDSYQLTVHPNPFNPNTQITFSLPEASTVSLRVFDLLGKEVALLLNQENRAAGSHSLSLNAGRLASGIYLLHLETSLGVSRMTKITVVK